MFEQQIIVCLAKSLSSHPHWGFFHTRWDRLVVVFVNMANASLWSMKAESFSFQASVSRQVGSFLKWVFQWSFLSHVFAFFNFITLTWPLSFVAFVLSYHHRLREPKLGGLYQSRQSQWRCENMQILALSKAMIPRRGEEKSLAGKLFLISAANNHVIITLSSYT